MCFTRNQRSWAETIEARQRLLGSFRDSMAQAEK
jgi:hypothetical protein